MPYQREDGRTYVDLAELAGPKTGGHSPTPGISRQTIRRLARAERWPEPASRIPRVSWLLDDVAAAMRDLGIPIPREWGLPGEGDGGLDLSRWVVHLPAGVPLRATEIHDRWIKDGGGMVTPANLGRGLATLCAPGGPLCRWKRNGGWVYMRGVRPVSGKGSARRRAGDWTGIRVA